jgi:predicted MFS family arabinose efflux permease
VCLGNISISFNTGAVAAAIPLISQDLDVAAFLVAKIVPFYMIPYGLGALLYAPLTRFFSYRLILASAMALYGVAAFISGASESFSKILLAQILAGVAAASSTPLSLMIIGDFFEKNIRGRLVGIYFGSSFLASVVGMIFMGTVDWRFLFFIPAGLGFVTAFLLFVFPIELLNRKHTASINYFKVLSHSGLSRIFIFIFLMSALYHAVHKWYGLYLHQVYGLDKEMISLFLIVAAVFGLSGQNIGGYLSDKKGRAVTCFVGGSILAVGTIGLFFHYPLALVPLVLGVISIGWTISHNSISTILTDCADGFRPMVASLNSSVRFVSGGLGFLLSAFFVQKSFETAFLLIGVLFLILTFSQKFFIESKL